MKEINITKIPSEDILELMEDLLNVASDLTRLKILYCISEEEKIVSQIVEEVECIQSLVSLTEVTRFLFHSNPIRTSTGLKSRPHDGTRKLLR